MLLTDTFTRYCQNLNNNMGSAVQHMIDMDKKYSHMFPLHEHVLRQRFTTNTKDDHTTSSAEPHQIRCLDQEPFISMTKFIVHKNLLPNFFKKETLDYIRQADPQYVTATGPLSPFNLLHGLLVWSTFDEAVYLQQKNAIRDHKAQPEEIRNFAKKQMAAIACDPLLRSRFMESIHR
jgi:hypothetical protein